MTTASDKTTSKFVADYQREKDSTPKRPDSPVSSEDKLRERVSKLGKKYETSDDVRNDIVDLAECELHSTS
jgi:hypothetical protein